MPCYDPRYVHSRGDAILCGLFHEADRNKSLKHLIENLDYQLIGLSRKQVQEWWEDHKVLDAQKLKEKR